MWARSTFSKCIATLCAIAMTLPGPGSLTLGQDSAPPLPSPGDQGLSAPALPSADGEAPEGVEVLTRGPVHEAFATPAELDPKPGPIVNKEPPAEIEEVPPDEKPEGKNVVWIPGYYAWDDDREDFIWISGLWRNAPPGQQWVPGYWTKSDEGVQWTPGFWAAAEREEVEYIEEAPPQTLEAGPNGPAPSDDHFWIPGSWVYRESRYAWRPGFWAVNQPNWIWTPARYVWCPSGYVFVDGYWDYVVARRGCLFAPVYFTPVVYARPAFVYTPSVVINAGFFTSHLFYRPAYCSYYFGDYYAVRYSGLGFRPWFSVGIGWSRGYDPLYSYYRWHNHRHNPHWANHLRRDFDRRRHNEFDRPPHTFAQQKKLLRDPKYANRNDFRLASTIKEASRTRSATDLRLRTIDSRDRLAAVERSKDYKKIVNARLDVEKRTSADVRRDAARRDDVRRDQVRRDDDRRDDARRDDGKRDIARSGQDRDRAADRTLAGKFDQAKTAQRRTLKLPTTTRGADATRGQTATRDRNRGNVAQTNEAPRRLEQLDRDRKLADRDRGPASANQDRSARANQDRARAEQDRSARNAQERSARGDQDRSARKTDRDTAKSPTAKSPFVDSDANRGRTAEAIREQREARESARERAADRAADRAPDRTPDRTPSNVTPGGNRNLRPNTGEATRKVQPKVQTPSQQPSRTPSTQRRTITPAPQGRTLTQPNTTSRSAPEPRRSLSTGREQTTTPRAITPRANPNPGGASSLRQRMQSSPSPRQGSVRSSYETRQMLEPSRSGSSGPSGVSPRNFSPPAGGKGPSRSRGARPGRNRSADATSPRSDLAIESPGAVAGISPVINDRLTASSTPAARPRSENEIEDPNTVRKEQREVSQIMRLKDDVNQILGRETPAETERRSSFSLLRPEEQSTRSDFRAPHPDARNLATGSLGAGGPTTEMGRPLDASLPAMGSSTSPTTSGPARADRATVMSQTDPRGPGRPKVDYDYRSMVRRGQTLSSPAAGTYARVNLPEEGESFDPLRRRGVSGTSSYTSTPNRAPFFSGPNSPSMLDASAAAALTTSPTARPAPSSTLPSTLPSTTAAPTGGAGSLLPADSRARWPSLGGSSSVARPSARPTPSYDPTRATNRSYDPTRSTGSGYDPTRSRTAPRNYFQSQ